MEKLLGDNMQYSSDVYIIINWYLRMLTYTSHRCIIYILKNLIFTFHVRGWPSLDTNRSRLSHAEDLHCFAYVS